MEEVIVQAINTTINSFDIAFCVIVNVLTFLVTKIVSENIKLTVVGKRLILVLSITIVSAVYIITGSDSKLIFNSAILAPVFWSWILKPALKKVGIEYTKLN